MFVLGVQSEFHLIPALRDLSGREHRRTAKRMQARRTLGGPGVALTQLATGIDPNRLKVVRSFEAVEVWRQALR